MAAQHGSCRTGRFDVLGYRSEQSATLREALETSARYGRIVTEGPRLELSEEGDLATLRLTRLAGESPAVRLTAEFSTISLLLARLQALDRQGADRFSRRALRIQQKVAVRAHAPRGRPASPLAPRCEGARLMSGQS